MLRFIYTGETMPCIASRYSYITVADPDKHGLLPVSFHEVYLPGVTSKDVECSEFEQAQATYGIDRSVFHSQLSGMIFSSDHAEYRNDLVYAHGTRWVRYGEYLKTVGPRSTDSTKSQYTCIWQAPYSYTLREYTQSRPFLCVRYQVSLKTVRFKAYEFGRQVYNAAAATVAAYVMKRFLWDDRKYYSSVATPFCERPTRDLSQMFYWNGTNWVSLGSDYLIKANSQYLDRQPIVQDVGRPTPLGFPMGPTRRNANTVYYDGLAILHRYDNRMPYNMTSSIDDRDVFGELMTKTLNKTTHVDANGLAFIKEAPEVFSQLSAYQKVLSEKTKNLARNLSSAELATRYGITLTLADIQAYQKGLKQIINERKAVRTQRSRESFIVKMDDDYLESNCYFAYRVAYATTIHNTLIALSKALDDIGLFPTAQNIWDLVPYSFVANWFYRFDKTFSVIDASLRAMALPVISETQAMRRQSIVVYDDRTRLQYTWYRRSVSPIIRVKPAAGSVLEFHADEHSQELIELGINGMWSSLVRIR